MPNQYPCATIAEMAAIPLDARPRMLAELPSILLAIDNIQAAAPDLAAEMKAKAPRPWRWLPLNMFVGMIERGIGKGAVWVDDDKGLVTISARVGADDRAFYTRIEPHDPR